MDNVVLVDESNLDIGVESKLKAHQKGLLHRAFSIVVYNTQREILLQKRAETKYHTPGLWTNTCCSHPLPSESYEDAAHRRLDHEMGLSCNLDQQFSFLYKAEFANGLIEHEHDTVFIGQTNTMPNINPDEASNFKYISIEDLKNEIKLAAEEFTPWFRIMIDRLDHNFFSYKQFSLS